MTSVLTSKRNYARLRLGGRVIVAADNEDRCLLRVDGEVANLEGAALPFVSAGARNHVAAAGIERRHAHDRGFDHQFLPRQPPPTRVAGRDHLHARQLPDIADPFAESPNLHHRKASTLQPLVGECRAIRTKQQHRYAKAKRAHLDTYKSSIAQKPKAALIQVKRQAARERCRHMPLTAEDLSGRTFSPLLSPSRVSRAVREAGDEQADAVEDDQQSRPRGDPAGRRSVAK